MPECGTCAYHRLTCSAFPPFNCIRKWVTNLQNIFHWWHTHIFLNPVLNTESPGPPFCHARSCLFSSFCYRPSLSLFFCSPRLTRQPSALTLIVQYCIVSLICFGTV